MLPVYQTVRVNVHLHKSNIAWLYHFAYVEKYASYNLHMSRVTWMKEMALQNSCDIFCTKKSIPTAHLENKRLFCIPLHMHPTKYLNYMMNQNNTLLRKLLQLNILICTIYLCNIWSVSFISFMALFLDIWWSIKNGIMRSTNNRAINIGNYGCQVQD